MSGREITSCTPDDIRRFWVWKDQSVKVKFIRFITVFFMNKGIFDCDCPVRLDSDTVSLMLTRIVNMFNKMGCGSFWNIAYGLGNPLHQVE